MNYEALAALPAVAIIIVALFSISIKIAFQRKRPLAIEEKARGVFKGLTPDKDTLQATYHRKRSIFIFVSFTAVTVWAIWQLWTLSSDGFVSAFKPFYILFGAYALVQYFIASFVLPFRTKTDAQDTIAANLSTAIVVPVYNEDIEGLKKGLRSLMIQTVLPTEIHVVDDGSKVDYKAVQAWLRRNGKKTGVVTTWSRQANSGKRAAQLRAFSKINTEKIDIVITVDSDGELDPRALEEGLKPFAVDRDIQSVAGVVIAKNAQHNILARITDLIFTSHQQLIDRAAMSSLKSVIVNSGGLALYRKEVFLNAIKNNYDDEYFMGRRVTFSDDSYLTLIALKMGKTVQQPTAIVFSDMPVNVSHHVRQQVRWGRGSFIRGWWRVRHLPLTSPGFLRQVFGWMVFTSITIVQVLLFIIIPLLYGVFPSLYLLLMPLLFVLLLSSRYFSLKRSDMTFRSQLYTYLLSPVALVWSAIVMRSIRLYAILTCLKTGWGTRENVEIVYAQDGSKELATSAS